MNAHDWWGGVCFDPCGGNRVHIFSLGLKAVSLRSRDVAGAGLPTECLVDDTNRNIYQATYHEEDNQLSNLNHSILKQIKYSELIWTQLVLPPLIAI